jgi:hypothetical protein
LDQCTDPDGYPGAGSHIRANLHQTATAAQPDADPIRYALGHLDAEPHADRYSNPDSHPDSFAKLHPLPNLDAKAN